MRAFAILALASLAVVAVDSAAQSYYPNLNTYQASPLPLISTTYQTSPALNAYQATPLALNNYAAAPVASYTAPLASYAAPVASYAAPVASYAAPVASYAVNPYAYAPGYSNYSPANYAYGYGVNDGYGSRYAANEARTGDLTKGEYHVDLPDGRTEHVNYYVNGPSGYVAEVTFTPTVPQVAAAYQPAAVAAAAYQHPLVI